MIDLERVAKKLARGDYGSSAEVVGDLHAELVRLHDGVTHLTNHWRKAAQAAPAQEAKDALLHCAVEVRDLIEGKL